MEEYSIEWFKWHRDNYAEWLGTQALKLLEHYVELEAEVERLKDIANEEHAQSAHTAMRNGELEDEYEQLRKLSVALYDKIESSPDVCNLDEFDEWEKALGGE